jgi:hypothetical protein
VLGGATPDTWLTKELFELAMLGCLHVLGGASPNTWLTLYEACPVVKTTAMEVIVVSQNIPLDILELFTDFNPGGKFHINKAKLQRDGKALHTRYGEYFYVDVPDSAIALPESKELVEVYP